MILLLLFVFSRWSIKKHFYVPLLFITHSRLISRPVEVKMDSNTCFYPPSSSGVPSSHAAG